MTRLGRCGLHRTADDTGGVRRAHARLRICAPRQPSRGLLRSRLIPDHRLLTATQAAWSNTNSKRVIDAPLYPSRTSSRWSRLLLVPRKAMRTGNECMPEDRGMARRRVADADCDDRCDAGASAI